MNCYYHPWRAAVAQCPDCGKGLCRQCATQYRKPICPDCNKSRGRGEAKRYIKPLVICAVLFLVGCAVGAGSDLGPLLTGYLLASLYGGWGATGLLFSRIFILLDLRSIAIYLLVRVVLSVLVGVVATPVYLGYCVYKLIKMKG
jgi:hypothetical protein